MFAGPRRRAVGASLIGAVTSAEAGCRYYGPGSTGCTPPANIKPAPAPAPIPPKPTMQVGGATITGPAYTTPITPGQVGGVTYFGAPPVTYPTHNGQVGNVTYLNGVRPYTPPGGRAGQIGTVTFIRNNGPLPGTVPVQTVPIPGLRIR